MRRGCESRNSALIRVFQKIWFSLIELLVLIFVLSLLVAVLLPPLARARESARRSPCQYKLKQIALILDMYSGEARGERYPPKPRAPGNFLFALSTVYSDYLSDLNITFCPSDALEPPTISSAPREYSLFTAGRFLSPALMETPCSLASCRYSRRIDVTSILGGASRLTPGSYHPNHSGSGTYQISVMCSLMAVQIDLS